MDDSVSGRSPADAGSGSREPSQQVVSAVPASIPNATEQQAEGAIALLKRWINAAENSNQHGENMVVQAAAGPELFALAIQYRDDLLYPPDADSKGRRLAAINSAIANVEGRKHA